MFDNLSIIRLSTSMAHHAEVRQALSSSNVANLNTPNYRPKDLPSFKDSVQDMLATQSKNLNLTSNQVWEAVETQWALEKNNGNSVSLELELLRSVDIKRQHDRAISIYQFSTDVIRASIGK